jgi:hypothetical protein
MNWDETAALSGGGDDLIVGIIAKWWTAREVKS